MYVIYVCGLFHVGVRHACTDVSVFSFAIHALFLHHQVIHICCNQDKKSVLEPKSTRLSKIVWKLTFIITRLETGDPKGHTRTHACIRTSGDVAELISQTSLLYGSDGVTSSYNGGGTLGGQVSEGLGDGEGTCVWCMHTCEDAYIGTEVVSIQNMNNKRVKDNIYTYLWFCTEFLNKKKKRILIMERNTLFKRPPKRRPINFQW